MGLFCLDVLQKRGLSLESCCDRSERTWITLAIVEENSHSSLPPPPHHSPGLPYEWEIRFFHSWQVEALASVLPRAPGVGLA